MEEDDFMIFLTRMGALEGQLLGVVKGRTHASSTAKCRFSSGFDSLTILIAARSSFQATLQSYKIRYLQGSPSHSCDFLAVRLV